MPSHHDSKPGSQASWFESLVHKHRRRHHRHRHKRRKRNYLKFIMPSIVVLLAVATGYVTLKVFFFRAKPKPVRVEQTRPPPKQTAALDAETLVRTNEPREYREEFASNPLLDPADILRRYSNRVPASAPTGLSSAEFEARDSQRQGARTNASGDIFLDPTAAIQSLSNRVAVEPAPTVSSTGLAGSVQSQSDEERLAQPTSRSASSMGSMAARSEPSERDKRTEARAMFGRATSLYQSGDLVGAELLCDQIVRSFPESHWAHNMLGEIHARQQKWAKAIARFEEAVKLAPDNGEYHNNLGLIYGNQGKNDLSEQHLVRAAKLDPLNVTVLMNCGWHFRKLKNYPEALKYLDMVLVVSPDNSQVRNKRIQTLLDMGEFAQVEEAIKEQIAAKPQDMHSYMIMAASRSRQGDAPGAVEWLRKAEQLTSRESMRKLLEKVNDFDNIKNQPQYQDYLASLKGAG